MKDFNQYLNRIKGFYFESEAQEVIFIKIINEIKKLNSSNKNSKINEIKILYQNILDDIFNIFSTTNKTFDFNEFNDNNLKIINLIDQEKIRTLNFLDEGYNQILENIINDFKKLIMNISSSLDKDKNFNDIFIKDILLFLKKNPKNNFYRLIEKTFNIPLQDRVLIDVAELNSVYETIKLEKLRQGETEEQEIKRINVEAKRVKRLMDTSERVIDPDKLEQFFDQQLDLLNKLIKEYFSGKKEKTKLKEKLISDVFSKEQKDDKLFLIKLKIQNIFKEFFSQILILPNTSQDFAITEEIADQLHQKIQDQIKSIFDIIDIEDENNRNSSEKLNDLLQSQIRSINNQIVEHPHLRKYMFTNYSED